MTTPQLNSALAMTYYRQDRFPEAVRYFKDAAGPLPLAAFQDLRALAAQCALFDGRPAYQIDGPETATIPFMVRDPLPVVPVSINGAEPLPFFIDTGAAEVIVDRELAERVGAISSGSLRGEGGGTKGAIGLGKTATVSIGEASIRNVPIHLMDTGPFAAVFDGLPVKGIIGTRLLLHFLATIDYVNSSLVLRHGAAATSFAAAPTARKLPFWLVQTHYMVTYGRLNGRQSELFSVDTGLAGKGFSAPAATLRKAGIAVDWSQGGSGVAGFGETETVDITAERLSLGNGQDEVVALDLPGVAFKKPSEVLEYKLGFWVGGVVSHQFFRDFALTLDFTEMTLVLQK